MNLVCIGDEATVRGLRLAGIAGQTVTTSAEAAAALNQALAQPDCGIIVLTEFVAAGLRQKVEAIRDSRLRQLIVEIPGAQGISPQWRELRQMVHEAVGVRTDEGALSE